MSDKGSTTKSYKYKRYIRDGSVREITAVVRSRAKKKKETKNDR